ncbi:MAG: MOSC domain-containing protein [Anaerolineae bacterium]
MELRSIQVGKVQTHNYNGETWVSGYMKHAVSGRVRVGKINVEGDQQHHTDVHGGEHRAVLMYCAEHYDLWQGELGQVLPYGAFAENFTVSGLDETSVCIGDVYQIGDTVRVQVSQPRRPCQQIYKALGIYGIVKKVHATYRSGWYCRVLQEGAVEAGMPVERISRLYPDWTIWNAHEVMDNRKERLQDALTLANIEELEPGWREVLRGVARDI